MLYIILFGPAFLTHWVKRFYKHYYELLIQIIVTSYYQVKKKSVDAAAGRMLRHTTSCIKMRVLTHLSTPDILARVKGGLLSSRNARYCGIFAHFTNSLDVSKPALNQAEYGPEDM